jgi:hypothetical protein
VWKDDSHVSTDRKVLLSLAEQSSTYFNKIHVNIHYGASKYTFLEDSLMNDINTSRLT